MRRGHLARALRVADVREELLATLAALSDFAYGWGALDAYLPRLHAQVPPLHACEVHASPGGSRCPLHACVLACKSRREQTQARAEPCHQGCAAG